MINSERPAVFFAASLSNPIPEAKIQDYARYPQSTVFLIFAHHFHSETSPFCKTEIWKDF